MTMGEEQTGAQFLAEKFEKLEAQIAALHEDLGTIFAMVELLGKAGKYTLVKTPVDGGITMSWEKQKGRIVTI